MITNPDQPTLDRSRLRRLVGSMALLTIPMVVIWWPGCHKYPVATSVASYGLMEALYTACNTRNSEWLAKVEKKVEQAAHQGKLSTSEQDSFRQIIGLAKAGDWAKAEQAAYEFADDQRGRGLTTFAGSEEHGHGLKKHGEKAKGD